VTHKDPYCRVDFRPNSCFFRFKLLKMVILFVESFLVHWIHIHIDALCYPIVIYIFGWNKY
jgi:hypothetical protein